MALLFALALACDGGQEVSAAKAPEPVEPGSSAALEQPEPEPESEPESPSSETGEDSESGSETAGGEEVWGAFADELEGAAIVEGRAGLGYQGVGPQNTGPKYGGLGDIGTIGHGAGEQGSSYGGGSKKARKQERVTIAKVRSQGPPKDIVERIIKHNLARAKSCYLKELKRDPDSKGKLELKLVINAQGVVVSSEVEGYPALAPCVSQAGIKPRFPSDMAGEASVWLRFELVEVSK